MRVMDLERIKQNLRLRSGRAKKPRKAQAPPSSQQPTPAVANGPAPTHPPTPPSSKSDSKEADSQKDESPKEPAEEKTNSNINSGPESRPETPHAATGLVEDAPQSPGGRYGRSGIEKPRKKESNAPFPPQQTMTDSQNNPHSDNSDGADFDLRPPAPRAKPPSLEATSQLLFSAGHLNILLQDPQSVAKFTRFLSRYKPEFQPLILRYLETQKAIKAVAYANAIAEGVASEEDGPNDTPSAAAALDKKFEEASASTFSSLVGTALPMYITYTLVRLVTECLVHEITGKQTPIMRNLVGGLSEVFCLTDANQEDNPIIYASEEFYRLTGYGTDDVIGNNCRFLQGAKTNKESPRRIKKATENGEEHYETLLNYRRDGRPFINLLMIAPLHDNKGKLKYHIGAQVDVTGLIEGGKALDSFERYLQLKQNDRGRRKENGRSESKQKSKALLKLQELSEMFDIEESAVVQSRSRGSSMSRDSDSVGGSERRQRRVFVDSSDQSDQEEEAEQDDDKDAWKLGQGGPHGPSGKLPGVYDSFMLVRPAPSLRVIFASPKLRKLGNVVQKPFLAQVAAPATTLEGLKDSFSTGTPVSAKIGFMPKSGEVRDGTKTSPGTNLEDGKYGKTCWISATPLLGSDDQVGVWMVVFVERNKTRRSTQSAEVEAKLSTKAQSNKSTNAEAKTEQAAPAQERAASRAPQEELPIKPKRLDDLTDGLPDHEDPKSETQKGPATDQEPRQQADQPDDDEGFVQTKASSQAPQTNGRIKIEPDSEDDEANGSDWHAVQETSKQDSPEAGSERKYTPPPEIPDSMQNATPPRSPSLQDEETTPTRTRVDPEEERDEEDGDSSPDRAQAKNHMGMLPMDYLRHPGTQRSGKDGENWTDIDCMRSPYSVD